MQIPSSVSSYLIYPIISVSFLRGVFTVFATLAAAHDSNWFSRLPVLCIGSIFVVDRDVAVESQRPVENQSEQFRYKK